MVWLITHFITGPGVAFPSWAGSTKELEFSLSLIYRSSTMIYQISVVFFCCTVGEYWNDALAESSGRSINLVVLQFSEVLCLRRQRQQGGGDLLRFPLCRNSGTVTATLEGPALLKVSFVYRMR